MIHTLRVPLLSTSILAALVAGCGPGLDGAAPEGDGLDASSHSIIGGQKETGYSAVAMLYHDYGYLCSGTMIDDRVFLTAAHCIETNNAGHYTIYGGTDLNNDEPDWLRFAESVHVHPQAVLSDTNIDHDVGIVILGDDAPVTPYRWLDIDDNDEPVYTKGTEFQAVGYGITNGGGSGDGIKRSVTLNIDEVYSNIFTYGTSSYNTCSGDSGGPAVAEVNGYLTVIGTVSFGDYDCSQYGADMRTDDNRSFIEDYASPNAGRAKVGGSGAGGDESPIACSVASVESRSPLAAVTLAMVAFAGLVRRRR